MCDNKCWRWWWYVDVFYKSVWRLMDLFKFCSLTFPNVIIFTFKFYNFKCDWSLLWSHSHSHCIVMDYEARLFWKFNFFKILSIFVRGFIFLSKFKKLNRKIAYYSHSYENYTIYYAIFIKAKKICLNLAWRQLLSHKLYTLLLLYRRIHIYMRIDSTTIYL